MISTAESEKVKGMIEASDTVEEGRSVVLLVDEYS